MVDPSFDSRQRDRLLQLELTGFNGVEIIADYCNNDNEGQTFHLAP